MKPCSFKNSVGEILQDVPMCDDSESILSKSDTLVNIHAVNTVAQFLHESEIDSHIVDVLSVIFICFRWITWGIVNYSSAAFPYFSVFLFSYPLMGASICS